MQLAGTIAVALSVLVFAFQARALAQAARTGNQLAASQTDLELIALIARTNSVFLDYPELLGKFLTILRGRQLTRTPGYRPSPISTQTCFTRYSRRPQSSPPTVGESPR
jgi:hypothetical protein